MIKHDDSCMSSIEKTWYLLYYYDARGKQKGTVLNVIVLFMLIGIYAEMPTAYWIALTCFMVVRILKATMDN